jgi:poly-gamma-glutamate capsule biosynthesis protein CapA/YwtB (metallophosphatase superfamily)
MNRYLKISLPIIFLLAVSLGIYQWQFNSGTIKKEFLQKQNSGSESLEDYYNSARELANSQDQMTEVSFLAVGDIMLSRNVAGVMAKNGKDGLYPFRNLDALLTGTDFNFGNLESPFSGREDFNPTGSLVFNAPTWTISGLIQYNFKVLNLANNHAMDQGIEGLLNTQRYLAEKYLQGIGVGKNLDEAWRGRVFSTKGVKIGFIGASYSSLNDNGAAKNNYVARIEDTARLKKSIEAMKANSDFVVVTMHAGTEYERTPNQSQIDFAHTAVDYGADLVIGAHPHWIQTTEKYKGKHIFYSLGNFVFDQEWSRDTKEGLTLRITVAKKGVCSPGIYKNNQNPYSPSKEQTIACSDDIQGTKIGAELKQIELIPVIIENYSTPRLANEAEIESIFKKIGATTSVITP